MGKIDVICVGAAIVDIPLQPVSKNIFDVDSYPLERIAMTTGGDAINEAMIISRLGHKTALNSRIGNDAAGHFILERCRQENIDIYSLRMDEGVDTSINVGLVTSDGERTFVTNRNGSLWKLALEHVDFSRFAEARLLSLASIFNNPLLDGNALKEIFIRAKAQQLLICADMIKPRLGETLDDIREALSYVDFLFPNYEEAKLLTGETSLDGIADSFLACGVKTVVIKTGKKGCFIKNSETRLEVPAVKGITAIDTIGAGDNFASGFICGLLEDKSLRDCALFANATAAISVLSVGATTGVKNRQLVEQLLDEYEG
ncbi:sugar kinase [Escherichia coli]|nr:sugar kinase [Escherichia coli]